MMTRPPGDCVDPIHAHLQLQISHGCRELLFAGFDSKVRPLGFVVQPLFDERDDALLFRIEIGLGPAVLRCTAAVSLQCGGDVLLNQGVQPRFCAGLKEGIARPQLCPQVFQDLVHHRATLARFQSPVGRVHRPGVQPPGGEGLEWAGCLAAEYFSASGVLLDRPGKDCCVFFFHREGREFACGQVFIRSDRRCAALLLVSFV